MTKAVWSVEDLKALSKDELIDYLEQRFTGKTATPSIYSSHDERPEDFVIAAIRNFKKTDFLDKIQKVTTELLEIETKKAVENSRVNELYLSHLLILAETYRFRSARDSVRTLADLPLLRGKTSDYEVDLSAQALRTLAGFQDKTNDETKRWEAMLENPDSPYKNIAFFGMRLLGFDKGVKALITLVQQIKDDDGIKKIGLSLNDFIFQYHEMGLPNIVEKIIGQAKKSKDFSSWEPRLMTALDQVRPLRPFLKKTPPQGALILEQKTLS